MANEDEVSRGHIGLIVLGSIIGGLVLGLVLVLVVFAGASEPVITGAAFYQDRYERGEDGRWRIAHTGYVRTYEAMMSLDELPSFKITSKLGTADADAGVR